jgi:hypothetical protein
MVVDFKITDSGKDRFIQISCIISAQKRYDHETFLALLNTKNTQLFSKKKENTNNKLSYLLSITINGVFSLLLLLPALLFSQKGLTRDPGARTPIGTSGIIFIFHITEVQTVV